MAHSPHLFLLLLVLLLGCLVSLSTATPADLNKVCSTTEFPKPCVKHLSADPASHAADTHTLGTIALRLTSQSAHDTSNAINEMLKAAGADDCLSDCAVNYSDAIHNIGQTTTAIAKTDFDRDDVDTWLSAALTDAEICADSCNGVASATKLLEMNDNFNQLCSIALSVITNN